MKTLETPLAYRIRQPLQPPIGVERGPRAGAMKLGLPRGASRSVNSPSRGHPHFSSKDAYRQNLHSLRMTTNPG